jgi:hypothetical protein
MPTLSSTGYRQGDRRDAGRRRYLFPTGEQQLDICSKHSPQQLCRSQRCHQVHIFALKPAFSHRCTTMHAGNKWAELSCAGCDDKFPPARDMHTADFKSIFSRYVVRHACTYSGRIFLCVIGMTTASVTVPNHDSADRMYI